MAKKQSEVTIKELLETGAHFGHQTHRWNPKMKPYIFEARNGIYIIDLAKTLQQIRTAIEVVKDVVAQHKSILFVGTKKQAKVVVRECAEECSEFYVNERWLGGALTTLFTIRQSVKTLERFEKKIATGGEGLTKKEISLMTKEQVKLNRNLSGIRAMRKLPGLVVVVDPGQEHIAVKEANKLGIPILALVDTNCDPDPIDYVIACNDDALKSVKLILQALTAAVIEQKSEMKIAVEKGDKEEAEEEEMDTAEEEGKEFGHEVSEETDEELP
ncbi:MAG TPA: 30S ribosomal protein S2 [Rhabdochlamydiaceae bacterium]|nr:30S ribosomal protein S2 [Rhabdochlamydiaceae bacterium]